MRSLLLLSLVYIATVFGDSSEEFPKPRKGKPMKKFNKMIEGDNMAGPMPPTPFGMGPMVPMMGPFGFGPMGMGMGMGMKGPEGEMPPMPQGMRFRGKFMKGGFRGGFPPMPPFLQNVGDETRRQVAHIMGDMGMTIEEKDARIEEILRNESPEVQEAFTKFKAEMTARRAEMEQKLAVLREKLSPAAREADEALTKIMKDLSLSPMERKEQIREMFTGLPMDVKMELRELRRGMGNKVSDKIREVGHIIGDVRLSIMDAFRSALGVGQQNGMEIRRAPMRRLKKFPEPAVQLETKPIAISDDEKFVEF